MVPLSLTSIRLSTNSPDTYANTYTCDIPADTLTLSAGISHNLASKRDIPAENGPLTAGISHKSAEKCDIPAEVTAMSAALSHLLRACPTLASHRPRHIHE